MVDASEAPSQDFGDDQGAVGQAPEPQIALSGEPPLEQEAVELEVAEDEPWAPKEPPEPQVPEVQPEVEVPALPEDVKGKEKEPTPAAKKAADKKKKKKAPANEPSKDSTKSDQWATPVSGPPEEVSAAVAAEPVSVKMAAPVCEADDSSTEATPSGEKGDKDLSASLLTLFQESKVPSLPELRSLLQSRADPNHRYEEEFELHNVKWNDGCPLQFGVTSGDRTIVQLLLQYNGDIHRSSYSKKAGASGQLWVGNAPFAALPADNVDMLQLLVESHSVSPDLGSTVGGKPGAKMLWNSSYFGALKCTRYLLEARAAVDETAPWQDNTALNYTPLHVAARAGNEKCCELLLQFSADMKGKCHVKITEQEGYILKGDWYFTPLDTAIEMSQISVVKLLLQKKADLISGKDVHCLTSAKDKHLRVDRRNYSLQSLLRSGNSRVISEVARSLQDRWQQMTLLTVQDIVRFLETPGDAPVELMKALFHEHSQIKYWLTAAKSARGCKGNGDKYDTYFRPEYIMAVKQSPTRVYAQSANIRKMLVYGQVQYVINFTEGPSNEDVEKHWKNRSYMEDQIPRFVDRLAPQPTKDRPLSQRLREQVMGECTYLPVNFFACLVPNMHRSEEVLLAIADCPNQEIFRLRECEAIVSFNWTTVQLTQLVDLGIQAVTSLMVLLSISTFRDEAADWCNKLPVFAGIGLPLVILTLLMRIGEVIGNQLHKAWDVYSEVALHLATLALFIVFLSSGEVSCQSRGIIDNLWMRSAIILVSSLRLLTCCDMMRLALSEVNMIVTPILSALMKSLPFCIAVIYFAFILWQAYWTLDVEEWQNGWKAIIIAWRFAVLGDFEVEELEGQEGTWHQEDDGSGGIMLTYEDPQLTTNSTVVRGVFIVLCGMMFPVLIMNILISVLSVWLSFALKNVWLDFQQARARRVLRYKAMTRIWSCKRRHQDTDLTDSNAEPSSTRSLNLNKLINGGSPGYIWFSAPKEEEILQDDIDPGLNLKFKEATEGANRIESRLTNLERNVQLLVDTTAKNEKRRAKQTFEKAFTGARDA